MFRSLHTRPPRRGRPLLVALAVGAAMAGPTACASDTGPRDGGIAPSLSPPTSASPLWPEYAPPAPPLAGDPTPTFTQYPAVEGVLVPAGGLREVSAQTLLAQDPNVPKLVRVAVEACPGPRCGLRKPVYRDLTGDGRDELIVAVDEASAGLTLIQVYRASGSTVRPVLISWGRLGLTGETFGHDLVLTSTGDDGRFTTHYRWNGTVMTAGVRQDEDDPSPTPGVTTPPADGPTASPTSPQPRTSPTRTRTTG
ncbi:hypothetical protein OG883_14755 [Streptomyces sp. NBC_01142]|uniref:hypothetical protein n=1 Tax=Streptomyces sp. NBC_01142 TaxID=2975865 RepID=UPI00225442C3|nr:hypothetical protein [Streptomyces sp. NBC_01142]MCX4821151.1 hypothetical protein [Streptomyces sp. NBC_01142]